MIKGRGKRGDRDTIILGLSFENLRRLKQDKPIVIWKEEMDLPHDIIIFAEETEAKLIEAVRNPETIIHDQHTKRPLKN
jgi:hypothetical protein